MQHFTFMALCGKVPSVMSLGSAFQRDHCEMTAAPNMFSFLKKIVLSEEKFECWEAVGDWSRLGGI